MGTVRRLKIGKNTNKVGRVPSGTFEYYKSEQLYWYKRGLFEEENELS